MAGFEVSYWTWEINPYLANVENMVSS